MVENKMASVGTGYEVVTMDERAVAAHAAREMPNITSVNVSKSTRVHIGPKIVAVNQTIENKEMVKGQIFGLELVSANTSKRLRCSVAVFLCWTLLVATCLTVYLVYFVLQKQQVRIDIDLPLPKYIWSVMKNTTKAERLSCITALCTLVICMSLIVYYTAFNKKTTTTLVDIAPHEWRISREMWLAREYISNYTTEEFNPLKLVVVQHTVSTECHRFIHCAAEVRGIQDNFLDDYGWDIPYNFLIGNDGRVYEGRGWNREGAHTRGYNRCSVGIGFIGDYREEMPVYAKVTDAQLNRTRMLLEEGVREGHLVADYFIVGAKDVQATASPGSNLYNALQQMEHYDHDHQFAGKNCSVIYGHV